MERVFQAFFNSLIRTGTIEVTTASGRRFLVGDGSGKKLALRFCDPAAQIRFMLDPEAQFPELFMDGRIEAIEGSVYDFVMLGSINAKREGSGPIQLWRKTRQALRQLAPAADPSHARRNIAHHYDLSPELYSLFLDSDLQYSCAYFENADQSLEDAQLAKKRHLAAKLLIKPQQSVLDIGCGFGGLAVYLARFCDANVVGLTLSKEQLATAERRAAALGVAANFRLLDYREIDGRFDRIVSVGMFEHVGIAHYQAFFRQVAHLLDENGVALLHTIGRSPGPAGLNPWLTKYIFPGGYLPALSEILPPIERTGLFITDLEVLRMHYADTTKMWRDRFLSRRDEAKALYGERFCRMWEVYLAGSECSFRCEDLSVFQIQLSKRLDAVPLTRDYIARAETELRRRESVATEVRMAGE